MSKKYDMDDVPMDAVFDEQVMEAQDHPETVDGLRLGAMSSETGDQRDVALTMGDAPRAVFTMKPSSARNLARMLWHVARAKDNEYPHDLR
ncbi:hypothetical protein BO226_04745 [Rhodococcus sp. 2G]|uniref:hypothetical protein n=1 Tax=Rhodococcus sp. 2G TaxID=1570939 RepID=UPI000903B34D|nr:hypothetical protein [Rhodococcus sp. 2G]APE08615.1 hypothetical protein BO226_04745 [Rhodococcus sp. 2G]